MTYKAALAQLPCGGGKSVVVGNPQTTKTRELLAAVGRAVDSLAADTRSRTTSALQRPTWR